ncbi:MAG: D-2-hydroxyacid dehydrogenase family protein [Chloroflexota bacterium]|nr:D-2-hydroxyacid dehydrogenase family protein [Chloroflexota bacterium]
MKIAIPDDYQDAVRTLDCFQKLNGQQIVILREHRGDPEVLADHLQGVEALVLIRERTPIIEALLARLPDLRLIVQTGKRAPHIDLAACTRHGVAVVYATPPDPGRPYATSELTWGLILAAMRFIPQEVASMKAGHWQSMLGRTLHGRTLGIFGYGNIGRLVATYGQAFGMRVLAWGREGSRARAQADGIEVAASRDALFSDADVLSLHLVLTEETRGLVSAGDLEKMKASALFVNTSRAALIEPGALEKALGTGHPGYAAVDVYESEPVADHPLLHMDNVVCTPHLGYVEKDSYESLFEAAFDQLLAFIAGDRVNVANPEALKHV